MESEWENRSEREGSGGVTETRRRGDWNARLKPEMKGD